MIRTLLRDLAVLTLAWCCVALAATPGVAAEPEKAPPRDPVRSAFQLPRGVRLSPAQSQKYHKLRELYEPQLRSAIDQAQLAEGDREEATAAKAVLRLREEIHKAILSILVTSKTAHSKPGPAKSGAKRKPAVKRKKGPARRRKGHRRRPAGRKPAANRSARSRPSAGPGPQRGPAASQAGPKSPAAWQSRSKKPANWQKKS